MNKRSLALLVVALPIALLAACGGSDSGNTPTDPGSLEQAGGEATQAVCHEAQLRIDVPLSKIEEHFEHGDWLIGPEVCDGEDNDCDGHVDEGGVCEGDGGQADG